MYSTTKRHAAGAFTLIELLVVIAITGVLVGLLLPAVQAAREAARRMQCINNLKQLGVGFSNFASAKHGFPPRRYSRPNEGYTGWGMFLLPYIEQENLYNAYNWKYDFYDPLNKNVVETVIPEFVCPSSARGPGEYIICSGTASPGSANPDKTTTFTVKGYIDYCVPNGFTAHHGLGHTGPRVSIRWKRAGSDAGQHSRGLVHRPERQLFQSPRKLTDITDGLSNTLLVNECAGWPHQFRGRQRQRLADFNPANGNGLGNRGSWAGWQSFVYYTYSADGLMSSSANPTAGDLVDSAINAYNKMQMYSFHPNGASVLFCDGSVRFVNEDISGLTFSQIVLIADGQVIIDDKFQ